MELASSQSAKTDRCTCERWRPRNIRRGSPCRQTCAMPASCSLRAATCPICRMSPRSLRGDVRSSAQTTAMPARAAAGVSQGRSSQANSATRSVVATLLSSAVPVWTRCTGAGSVTDARRLCSQSRTGYWSAVVRTVGFASPKPHRASSRANPRSPTQSSAQRHRDEEGNRRPRRSLEAPSRLDERRSGGGP